jgi:Xaa-Pro aminopeptidase
MYDKRIIRLREAMQKQNIDCLILTPSTDLFYIIGGPRHMMERLVCLILTNDEIHYFAPSFEMNEFPEDKKSLMDCHGWSDTDDPFNLVKRFLSKPHKTAVGRLTPSWVLLKLQGLYPNSAWVSAENLLSEMRIKKDRHEYKLLKEAQKKACKALARLFGIGFAGRTEIQVSNMLRNFSAEEGIENNGGGVASGPNSASPHHSSTDRVIQKGDVVTIDFGGEEPGLGYQNDTTRTFCIGTVPEDFAEIYDTVNRANQAAFLAAQIGSPCEAVDQAARSVIVQAGYGEYFIHRTGHGLGLDTHERPYIARGNTLPIESGFVFSDEPGIYIPGKYGVRIEDQIFMQDDGPERLTPMEPPLDHGLKVFD